MSTGVLIVLIGIVRSLQNAVVGERALTCIRDRTTTAVFVQLNLKLHKHLD